MEGKSVALELERERSPRKKSSSRKTKTPGADLQRSPKRTKTRLPVAEFKLTKAGIDYIKGFPEKSNFIDGGYNYSGDAPKLSINDTYLDVTEHIKLVGSFHGLPPETENWTQNWIRTVQMRLPQLEQNRIRFYMKKLDDISLSNAKEILEKNLISRGGKVELDGLFIQLPKIMEGTAAVLIRQDQGKTKKKKKKKKKKRGKTRKKGKN
jgi:hypothetical protein